MSFRAKWRSDKALLPAREPEFNPFTPEEQASQAFINSAKENPVTTENHPRCRFKAVLYVTCSAEEDGGPNEEELAQELAEIAEAVGLTVEVKDVQVWDTDVKTDRE